MGWHGLNGYRLGTGPAEGSCKHVNESFGSLSCWEVLKYAQLVTSQGLSSKELVNTLHVSVQIFGSIWINCRPPAHIYVQSL
jgi:hypothetical protein